MCIIFFPRILIIQSECAGAISSSRVARALGGGKNGSPEKQYLIISNIIRSNPVAFSLSDILKST
jgi:hypothetical protein